jgi:hypothetical protein
MQVLSAGASFMRGYQAKCDPWCNIVWLTATGCAQAQSAQRSINIPSCRVCRRSVNVGMFCVAVCRQAKAVQKKPDIEQVLYPVSQHTCLLD